MGRGSSGVRPTGLVIRRVLSHCLLIVAAAATALFAVTVLAALGGTPRR